MKIKKYVMLLFFIFMLIIPSFLIFDLFPSKNAIRNVDKIESKAVIRNDPSGDVRNIIEAPAVHDPVDITTIDENASMDYLNVSFVGTPASDPTAGNTYNYELHFDTDYDNATDEYMILYQLLVGTDLTVFIRRMSDFNYWNGTDWIGVQYNDTNFAYVEGNNLIFNYSSCPDLIGDNWYNVWAYYIDAGFWALDFGIGYFSGFVFPTIYFAGMTTGMDVFPPDIADARCVPSAGLSGSNFTIKANVTDGTNVSMVAALIQRPDESTIQSIMLFDDGAHDDGAFNDSIFANSWNSTGQPNDLYYIDLWANDTFDQSRELENARVFVLGTGNETCLFDGMYYNWSGMYNYFLSPRPWNGTEEYHYLEGDMYLNKHSDSENGQDNWITDNATRYLFTNQPDWGSLVHDPFFIPKNLSLSDNVTIGTLGSDQLYTVSTSQTLDVLDVKLDCWRLDQIFGISVLYYEKSTGVLVNGTFDPGGLLSYTIAVDATNAFLSFSTISPENKSYFHSDVPVVITNASAVESAWFRNSTDGIIWSNNYTLAYNGTHYTNTTSLNWSEGSNGVQIFANNSDGGVTFKEQWFTVDTTGPWIELDSPKNLTYRYRTFPIMVSNYTEVDYIAFRYDEGSGWTANTTLPWNGTHYANDTIIWADGNYHLQVFANDSSSQMALREVWFIVKAEPPVTIWTDASGDVIDSLSGLPAVYDPVDMTTINESAYMDEVRVSFEGTPASDPTSMRTYAYQLMIDKDHDNSTIEYTVMYQWNVGMTPPTMSIQNASGGYWNGTGWQSVQYSDPSFVYFEGNDTVFDFSSCPDLIGDNWYNVMAAYVDILGLTFYYIDLGIGTIAAPVFFPGFSSVPVFSIISPKNITYYHSDIPIIMKNASLCPPIESAWYRNSTDGIIWSSNYTLAYNGSHFTNSTALNWSDGSNGVQIFANDSSGNEVFTEQWFTVDTAGPWVELDSPWNTSYIYRTFPIVVSNYTEVDYIAFSYNNGSGWTTNTTLPWNGTHYANDTITWADGNYHLQVFANDSSSQMALREVWFTVIATYPLNITHNSGLNVNPNVLVTSPGDVHLFWTGNITSDMEAYYDHNLNGHFGNQMNLSKFPAADDVVLDATRDSSGNIHVVWNQVNLIKYANNTGGTFNPPIDVPWPLLIIPIYPNIVVDSSNIVHIAIVGQDLFSSETTIHYTNNTGGSFSTPESISPGAYDATYPFSMEIDGSDVIHLAYACDVNGDFEIMYQNITNGIASTPVNVSNRAGADMAPSLAVNSTGTVHIAWTANNLSSGIADIFYSNNTGSFTPPQNVSRNGSVNDIAPCIALDETPPDHDIVFISWVHNSTPITPWSQMQLVITNDSYGSLGGITEITPFQTYVNMSNLAIDPVNQQIHIVWMAQLQFTGSTDYTNIFYTSMNYSYPINPGLNLILPLNQTYNYQEIPIVASNSSYVDTMWYRNNSGAGWSSNTTLFFNGTFYENQSAINWADGRYHIQVFANDSVGVEYMDEEYFTVDTQSPLISITDPTNGTFVTIVDTWINGTVDSTGSTISSLIINSSDFILIDDPTGTDAGTFGFQNQTGVLGNYTLLVTVTDDAGWTNSSLVSFAVDNLVPEINVTVPPGNGISGIAWFNGTVNGTGSEMTLYCNDSRFSLAAYSNGTVSGIFALVNNTNIPDGYMSLNLTGVDQAGFRTEVIKSVFVDNSVPTLTITIPLDGSINTSSLISINGTCNSTGSTISNIIINDTRFQLDIDPIGLTEGPYSFINNTDLLGRIALTVNVTDAAGFSAIEVVWFYVDNEDPLGNITIPAIDGTTISTIDIIINGTANGTGSPIQSVEINMTEFTLDIDPTGLMWGNYSFINNTALLEGLYVIEVNVTDEANRSRIITRSFYVDYTSPLLNVTDIQITGSIMWINGTANATGSLIASFILNDTVNFAIQTNPTGLGFGSFAIWNITNLNGPYVLNITVVDGAGFATENISIFIVDYEDPIVSITNPAIDGTAVSTIDIFINGTANGTWSSIQSVEINMTEFTIDIDPVGSVFGAFSFINNTALVEGQYVIEINVTDQVGRSTLMTRMFYIDRTAPSLNVTNPATNGTVLTGPMVWINGTVNATGSIVTSFLINDTINFGIQSTPVGLEEGNFSIWNITNLNGRYALNITAIDTAGYTDELIVWLYVDDEDPIAAVTIPAADGTAISTVDIIINGTANGTWSQIQSVEINMTEFTIDINPSGSMFGAYSFINNTALPEGPYTIEINVTDNVNRSRLITRMFYIDTTMPTLTITTPTINGTVIPDLTIWINGTANGTGSPITFLINDTVNFGIETDPSGLLAGNFSIWNVTRLNGKYVLNITVVDLTGNATEQIVWFYVDYEDPTGSITNPAVDGAVVSAIDILINGTANGTASPIQSVEINMTEFIIDLDPAGSLIGNFSFVNNTALAEGRYAIEINITDDANRSIIIIRMFYLDRSPPIVNLTSPATNGTSVSGLTIWINGTVNATGSVIVNFVINDTINFGIQANPSGLDQGNFSIWNITNLQETTYAVMINVTDTAGFEDYITIYFTVDNFPVGDPAIQLTVPGYDLDAVGGLVLNISGIAFGNSSLIAFIWMNDTNWTLSVDPSGTPNGPFVFSNNTFIPDGLYIINITVNNTDGLSASIVRSFYVDNTQPPAPANLTRNIVGSSVTLIWDWQALLDLTNVTFLIYRNSVNIANTTFTNFTDSNLSPGTYTYQIYAIDNAGNIGTAATETATIPGGGFDPRFIIIIIIIVLIAAAVAIASLLILRSRRRRPATAKKPVSKKSKIQMFEVPPSEKLKDIRLELRLKDLGFKVVHDTKESQNTFNLNTKEIIVKDMDNFVIARLRILAELTSDPVIITARMKALNEMNQFCQITASDFSALFKPKSLNIFIDTFQDNAVNTWLLQNTEYNTDIYQNNLSQKILEYQKIQKEMYLTGDQSKTRRFFNNLALGTLLALYSQNFGSDLLISSIISDPGLLRNIHDDFLNVFTQVKDKIPSAADYESFVTFLKGLVHRLWK